MKNTFKSSLYAICFLLTAFLISTFTHIKAQAQSISLELSADRLVHLNLSSPSNDKKPTLLLLPGVNRSVLLSDPSVQELKKLGFGLAIMNFSTQPFSVSLYDESKTPFFKKTTPKLADFVFEVEQVILFLKEQKKIQRVVPVSLSFSAAVSPFIQSVDLIIEVAPLTSSQAANPVLEQTIRNFKNAELFNPFFGPAITRSSLDSIYRKEWKPRVDAQISQFNLNPNYKDKMVDGYISMSRVVEQFVWQNIKVNSKVKRAFLIADSESKGLLQNQARTILYLLKNSASASMYFIRGAGHVIPADQPLAFAEAIQHAIETGLPSGGVADVTASTADINVFKATASTDFIKKLAQ